MKYLQDKLVHGIGRKGETYKSHDGIKPLKEYEHWAGLLRRCGLKYQSVNAAYSEVTCSINFKSYTFFYEWCQEQAGFGNRDEKGMLWQLDKDILVKGNRLYSEDTCVFVPKRLNTIFLKNKSQRGVYLIGTGWSKRDKMFYPLKRDRNGKQVYAGMFKDEMEAFLVYKKSREELIKEVANEYKEQLDTRAYTALMNYQVEETD